jgi:hypothetical protein
MNRHRENLPEFHQNQPFGGQVQVTELGQSLTVYQGRPERSNKVIEP